MPDEAKFTEGGVKMLGSVAGAMAVVMPATGPVGMAIGVVAFFIGIINSMKNDTTLADALNSLQSQLNEIKFRLGVLEQRFAELVGQGAIESNRATLRDLNDYLDEITNLERDLLANPNDLQTAERVANECGVAIDKFLRNDFDIWRWTDVVESEPALATGRFKNLPTLPVYLMGVLTWLAARERVVQAGQTARLADDSARITRHLNAVSVRDIFDNAHR